MAIATLLPGNDCQDADCQIMMPGIFFGNELNMA
jgi:hypothetical protein